VAPRHPENLVEYMVVGEAVPTIPLRLEVPVGKEDAALSGVLEEITH
jgi:hypothetical protein